MLRRISCAQVRQGMYVQSFGGSWLKHPFWRARFLLATPEDVAHVRQSGVPWVMIDESKGAALEPAAPVATSREPIAKPPRRPPPRVAAGEQPEDPRVENRRRAAAVVSRSKKVVRYVFDGARLGQAVRLAEVVSVVDEISAAIAVSPRTLLGVVQLKNKDEYTYLHSVAVCALMVCVARHMELDEREVRELGLAGLLHDIGKMGIPEIILNKEGRLTEDEFELVRDHPEHGYKLLVQAEGVGEAALDVCRHHHEKMDGSGYPFGLPEESITLAARLGAVCDVYDAVTSTRAYKEAWEPQQAIARMWSWEGHFDRKLLFTFMQAIGLFPVGMLVRLRSNRLGVILEKSRRSALPRALAFYDTRERALIEPEVVVLRGDLGGDQAVSPEAPELWGFDRWEETVERLIHGKGLDLAA